VALATPDFQFFFFLYRKKHCVFVTKHISKNKKHARVILFSILCFLFIKPLTLSTTHNHHHVAGHPTTIVAHRRN
jgi:hypothetical protein